MTYSNINIEIEGRVGAEPEVIPKKDGGSFVKLSVAVNRKIKDKPTGKEPPKAIWFVVNSNGWLADFAKDHIKKGFAILVSGTLDFQNWTDKNGVTHTTHQIFADRLRILHTAKLMDSESDSVSSDVEDAA